jgi:hypothetical protein
MIGNASNRKLNENPGILPNLTSPIRKWVLDLEFIRVSKCVIDGEVQESDETVKFSGVVQNLDFRMLKILPEAQRAWTWKMIHSLTDLSLTNDDKIKYRNVNYRVMNIRDFNEYGFFEYHIVEDYKNDI